MFYHIIVLFFRLLYAIVLSSDVFDARTRVRACVCVVHWHCAAQLSMFNMEKRFRNKIIIINYYYSCLRNNKRMLQDRQLPISLKKQVMDQCVLSTMTYGCQTCSLNKHLTNKLRTAQRAMERKMLSLELQDKIPCSEIRKRTKVIDIIEYTLKQKWRWARHIARMKDNRWTKRCAEWQPRRRKRSRGRPCRRGRWPDDITRKDEPQQQTEDNGRH